MLCFVRTVRRSQTRALCAQRMEMCSVSPSACLDKCGVDFGAKTRAFTGPGSLVVSRREPVSEMLGEMVESCAVGLPRMFGPFAMHVSYAWSYCVVIHGVTSRVLSLQPPAPPPAAAAAASSSVSCNSAAPAVASLLGIAPLCICKVLLVLTLFIILFLFWRMCTPHLICNCSSADTVSSRLASATPVSPLYRCKTLLMLSSYTILYCSRSSTLIPSAGVVLPFASGFTSLASRCSTVARTVLIMTFCTILQFRRCCMGRCPPIRSCINASTVTASMIANFARRTSFLVFVLL